MPLALPWALSWPRVQKGPERRVFWRCCYPCRVPVSKRTAGMMKPGVQLEQGAESSRLSRNGHGRPYELQGHGSQKAGEARHEGSHVQSLNGCGSKNNMVPTWNPVEGNMDQNLRDPFSKSEPRPNEKHSRQSLRRPTPQVLRWRRGASCGEVVAGGNGRGGGLHQLSYPRGIALDRGISGILTWGFGRRFWWWQAGAPGRCGLQDLNLAITFCTCLSMPDGVQVC